MDTNSAKCEKRCVFPDASENNYWERSPKYNYPQFLSWTNVITQRYNMSCFKKIMVNFIPLSKYLTPAT